MGLGSRMTARHNVTRCPRPTIVRCGGRPCRRIVSSTSVVRSPLGCASAPVRMPNEMEHLGDGLTRHFQLFESGPALPNLPTLPVSFTYGRLYCLVAFQHHARVVQSNLYLGCVVYTARAAASWMQTEQGGLLRLRPPVRGGSVLRLVYSPYTAEGAGYRCHWLQCTTHTS